jgi:hydroxymethylbilane synthase
VVEKLKAFNPEVDFEIEVIKTKGDKIQDVALDKIGDKGLFVKEIEEALLSKQIDIAIHSMKDMPSALPDGLKLAISPEREDYRDALILKEGLRCLAEVPKGGRIGTGSKRRKYQLLKLRPDLDIVPIRGNIDTRIKKIDEMDLHGIVLAAAGVKRLGLEARISSYFEIDEMIPAPAQGILAIEIRENDSVIEEVVSKIHHKETEIQAAAERAFLGAINGSCHIPMGAVCIIQGDKIVLHGMLGDEGGKHIVRRSVEGSFDKVKPLGRRLAEDILKEMSNIEG